MPASDANRALVALAESLHPEGAAQAGGDLLIEADASPAAARMLRERLAADGIAWVVAPRGRRTRARRSLSAAGLTVRGSWLCLPRRSPGSLLPLRPVAGRVRARLAEGLALHPGRALVLRLPARLLEELLPGVGLVVQQAGAPAPLEWYMRIGGALPVAVSAGWHDPEEGLALHEEQAISKSSLAGKAGSFREAEAIGELGTTARAAGAAVPTVLSAGPAGRRYVLREARLPGRRVADLLRRRPGRLEPLLEGFTDWLVRWHEITRRPRALTGEDVEQLVLEPARKLRGDVSGGEGYLSRLEQLARGQLGSTVPFAAAHNDLTTWNLLVDGAALGILDWETAKAESLPLVDLDYLIVDAVSAARGCPREEAFARCRGSGAEAGLARRLQDEARLRLGIGDELAGLVRHACWLGHARNESARVTPGESRPFLAIISMLAAS